MYKMQNLNVVRIVATEEEKSRLTGLGFKEVAEVKPDYGSMTVEDLKKLAKEKNIQGYSTMKKDELVKALAAWDDKDDKKSDAE